jgi:hypothetical protein
MTAKKRSIMYKPTQNERLRVEILDLKAQLDGLYLAKERSSQEVKTLQRVEAELMEECAVWKDTATTHFARIRRLSLLARISLFINVVLFALFVYAMLSV